MSHPLKVPPPLGLYVHIPWCVRKCPYCDFNSHPLKGDLPEQEYIQALLMDLHNEAATAGNRQIDTVFIGGGTPSLFQPGSIAHLLAGIGRNFDIKKDAEITLEANPGTLESGRFAEFVGAGINRISVGIQSFNDAGLKRLGRIHDRAASIQAVETALGSGARSVNIDLMYALPEQTLEEARRDLQTAFTLGPEHISWYQLTLEPNTYFFRQPPLLPDTEQAWAIQQCGQQLLAEAGYGRYEISAFSLPAAQARHNLNYWRFGDYLGIGAGAHGKLSECRTGRITRSIKHPHPHQYLAALKIGPASADLSRAQVGVDARVFEFMLNALRLVDGFEPALFEARTGLELHTVEQRLDKALSDGLLEVSPQNIRASQFGLRFLNDLVERFLEPETGSLSRGSAILN